MKFRKIFLITLGICLVCAGTFVFAQIATDSKNASSKLPANINFWSDYPSEELSVALVERMTDEELLSQVLMFGWAGAEPSELLNQWVDRGLGSVKVFGWNTDDIYQVARSVSSLQKRANKNRFKIPLFVATDQEGGWIRHVKGDTSITPGNMAIGAAGYPIDAWYSAFYVCREIKSMGINMNFAPTVDLFTNHNSTIIGPRSFGEDPDKSGILGSSFVSGSLAAGVIPTVKHFPGHGDTNLDSHGKLPVIDIDEKTFKNRELVPYEYLIKEEVPAVMSGHLSYPQIEPTGAPASLSKHILTDILRNELGFKGLIITDDMMMVGATAYAQTLSNAVKMALEAGNDIILSSTTAGLAEPLWVNNLQLLKEDKQFKDRIKESACRILKYKLDYFKSENAAPLYPEVNDVKENVPDKEGEAFFIEQACRSITLGKGKLPINKEKAGKILLAGSLQSFFKEGQKRFENASQYYFPYDDIAIENVQDVIGGLWANARNCDTVIISVSNAKHERIALSLKNTGKKVIVFSTMNPVYADDLQWADIVLYGYSWRCEYTEEALMAALNGEFVPEGQKPYK